MDVDQAMNDASYVDIDNQLNAFGLVQFWSMVDKQIEKFEKRQLALKPRGYHQQSNLQCGKNFNRRFKTQNRKCRTWSPTSSKH